jgi:hypothetical protein
LDLFTRRYQDGVDTYLQVFTSKTTALQNERNDIELRGREMEASVLLIRQWAEVGILHSSLDIDRQGTQIPSSASKPKEGAEEYLALP